MFECYKQIGRQLHKGKLFKCPNPLNCQINITQLDENQQAASCVVLFNEYKHTTMTGNLQIASAIVGDLLPSHNCLTN